MSSPRYKGETSSNHHHRRRVMTLCEVKETNQRVPWPESTLGASRYEAGVYAIAPFRYCRSKRKAAGTNSHRTPQTQLFNKRSAHPTLAVGILQKMMRISIGAHTGSVGLANPKMHHGKASHSTVVIVRLRVA